VKYNAGFKPSNSHDTSAKCEAIETPPLHRIPMLCKIQCTAKFGALAAVHMRALY